MVVKVGPKAKLVGAAPKGRLVGWVSVGRGRESRKEVLLLSVGYDEFESRLSDAQVHCLFALSGATSQRRIQLGEGQELGGNKRRPPRDSQR